MEAYKSNLFSQVGIVASSAAFVDYLRSGPATRQQIEDDLLVEIAKLRRNEVKSVAILDKRDEQLFSYGEPAAQRLVIDLCYLGSVLTTKYGICEHKLLLSLAAEPLLGRFQEIHADIEACESNCQVVSLASLVASDRLQINPATNVTLKLRLEPKTTWPFYVFGVNILLGVIVLGIWARRRVTRTLREEVIKPISQLAREIEDPRYKPPAETTVEELLHIETEHLKTKAVAQTTQMLAHDV